MKGKIKNLTKFILVALVLPFLFPYKGDTAEAPPTKDSNSSSMAQKEDKPEAPDEKDSKKTPWFVTPLLSSDPKISTAAGALAGYVHQFDEESPPSLLGLFGTYSTTDSYYYGAFAQTYSGKDKHRLTAALVTGIVRNDYSDFLGSGLNVQTTDAIHLIALRYVYRIYGHWYLGPQLISTNYAISEIGRAHV